MLIQIPDNVSEFTNVYDVLEERGLIENCTDPEGMRNLLGSEKIKFYVGFDPTADCLHVGHLIQIIIFAYFLKYGHTPVALIGGGTVMVGDPSGRNDMRRMMDVEEIDANGRAFKDLFDRFLPFDDEWQYMPAEDSLFEKGTTNREPLPGKAVSVNNAHWLRHLDYIQFVRRIGTCFNVPEMLRAESFKRRIAQGGLTFFEFNYMLMQGYDFYVMARDFGLKAQFGGSDQWSNIIAGVNINKKLDNREVFGMYQYWRNVADADVEKCLRMLTFLPMAEIRELTAVEGAEMNKAKERLAFEITKIVHGEEKAKKAMEDSRAIFMGGKDAASGNIPEEECDKSLFEGEGMGLAALMKEVGLVSSNGEGLRTIEQGGVKLNDEPVTDKRRVVTLDDFKDGKAVIQKGKKKFVAVVLK